MSHYERFGNICDIETFLNTFNNFDVIEVNESSNYLYEKLQDDYNTRKLADAFNKIRSLLLGNKVDEAIEYYKSCSDNLNKRTSLYCVDLIKDISRYSNYVDKTKNINNYYISTGLKELDKIVGGFDRHEELATIVARTNFGKCLAKGTKILMADGTLKNVEDIRVGDRVQSLNRINTVLGLHNGISHGYRIIPNVGDSFIVSENHILTIMQEKEFYDSDSRRVVTNNNFELKDIMIEDYLKLSKHKKHLSKLYRPSIEYSHKEQLIPPYILGLWLGDGTAREVSLTSMDDILISEWSTYAYSNNLRVSVFSKTNTECKAYSIVGTKGIKNPITQNFKHYNLLNNKHIPLDYLTGDENQRLELLAGILDTDGYLKNSTYTIAQKSKLLIEQIAQLCRGLGLKVGKISKKHNNKFNTDSYSISISGPTYKIPCRLERKINKNTHTKQSKYILTGFTVEPVDYVEYYGFMCDGDERYLLSDNTLTHNTWLLLKLAVEAYKQGYNVGIYSGEMSEDKTGYRVDTLLGHISNWGLTHGDVSIANEYKKYIDNLSNSSSGSIKVLTPNMISGPADVNSLKTFIESQNLDILFIDQLTLLEDRKKGKTAVDRMSNISRDLKNLQVMKRIPIVSVTQQNREKVENGVDTTQIGQSDRIGQDSTMIIFIEKKDEIMKLSLVKSRDSENNKKLSYSVDLNNGTFVYIPEGDEEDETVKDNLENRYSSEVYDDEEVF